MRVVEEEGEDDETGRRELSEVVELNFGWRRLVWCFRSGGVGIGWLHGSVELMNTSGTLFTAELFNFVFRTSNFIMTSPAVIPQAQRFHYSYFGLK